MSESLSDAQQFLACISDPSRFRLLARLAAGERCVTDLALDVGLSQSCTTRHLQALQRQGAVRGVRQGKRVVFRLCSDRPGLQPVLFWALSGMTGSGLDNRPRPAPGGTRGPAPAAPPEHESGWASDVALDPEVHAEVEAPTAPNRDLEDFLL